jgi:hypothetical protein
MVFKQWLNNCIHQPWQMYKRNTFLNPPFGGVACLVQRTLPCKSQMPLIAEFIFFAPMASVFLTPLPRRKVCPVFRFSYANRGIKPLLALSFMDYCFYSMYRNVTQKSLWTLQWSVRQLVTTIRSRNHQYQNNENFQKLNSFLRRNQYIIFYL